MPTQEERLDTLEKKTATAIREIDENTTIMLGVIRHQGQDIRKIFQQLETLETKFDDHTTRLERLEAKADTIQATLVQILARLPEKP